MKATLKQKKLMTKLGIDFDEEMSKNEAQDLITMELDTREAAEDLNYNPFLDSSDIPVFDLSGYKDDWNC